MFLHAFKIHQKMVTVEGNIMFGTIMICLLTWDKMRLNGFKKIVRSVLSNLNYCPST